MEIIRWDQFLQEDRKNEEKTALSIGVFDGVHIGHQKLISRLTYQQGEIHAGIITFSSNPAFAIGRPSFPGSILTLEQKLTKLELFGISFVILIDFSYEFSKITGKEFWLSLIHGLTIERVVVGQNFHFGYKRKGGIDTLRGLSPGMEVHVVEPVLYEEEIVSSTRIRTLIQEGRFSDVTAMLGNRYECDVRSMHAVPVQGDIWEMDLNTSEQVFPVKGTFPVLFITDTGNVAGNLVVQDKKIRWKKKADYKEIKNIIFI